MGDRPDRTPSLLDVTDVDNKRQQVSLLITSKGVESRASLSLVAS